MKKYSIIIVTVLFCALPLSSTATWAFGLTDMKKGKGGSEVQGAAGTDGAKGASVDLEHCDKPMGAIAVVEPQDFVMQALMQYKLQSPVGLIRMMIQQSNCFIVVERGAAMQNLMQERAMSEAGYLRQQSNMGGGQMVAADFILTPSIVFSESNAGGVGGALSALGGLFGTGGAIVGALAGGLKFKEAQTSMLLADARSTVQVASAEGSASKADWGIGGGVLGFAAGAYGNTNEGKIIAASFADNYSEIVKVIRNDPNLQRDVSSLANEAASGGKVKAGAVFNEGDVLTPKIPNIKLMSKPSATSKVLVKLRKSDEVIYMGEERDGYLSVETAQGGGWVKKVFVR